MEHFAVVIVGAGPVGLLIALRLGQHGIRTLVVESHHELLPTTRAVVYQPVVLDILDSFGIRKQVEERAYLNDDGIYWRDVNGDELGHLPMNQGKHILLFSQARMNALLLEEVKKHPSVEVRFGLKYAGCEQVEGKNEVTILVHQTSEQDEDIIIVANWLVGCDGANSAVRRGLCIPFEGFSFTEFLMIGVDVLHDFAKDDFGDEKKVMDFVVDRKDWAVVVYTGQSQHSEASGKAKPMWRVAYEEELGHSLVQKDIVARAQKRCAKYAHGKDELEVIRAEPYRLQQRCAAQAIKGRALLAGDALHANNPIGGLGLTMGICDAHAVGTALARVCSDQAPETLVAEAANDRRDTWWQITHNLSMANLERLRSMDPEHVTEREQFFNNLKQSEEMPERIWEAFERMKGRSFE